MIRVQASSMNKEGGESNDSLPRRAQSQVAAGSMFGHVPIYANREVRLGPGDVGYDPWLMYGGNIAAACQATNEAVSDSRQEEADDDKVKKRQREANRLIAWQSRERKRIEFEVMQERQAQLTQKNEELKKENAQIKLIIQRVAAAKQQLFSGLSSTAGSQAFALQAAAAAAANMTRTQPRPHNLLYAYQGIRGDFPSILSNTDSHQNLLFGSNLNLSQEPQSSNEGMLAPTVFAPLARQAIQQHQQQSLQIPFNLQGFQALPNRFPTPYLRTMTQTTETRKATWNAGDGPTTKRARKEPFNRDAKTS